MEEIRSKDCFEFESQEQDNLAVCINFLNTIGIPVVEGIVPSDSFLPGLVIEKGCIFIDYVALKFPGDLLHEAGHIAVIPAVEREFLNAGELEKRENRDGEEMAAIAWSYAACLYLELDSHFVFHDNGYNGGGNYIAKNFKEKKYFGVPLLQWMGLTLDEQKARFLNCLPYPYMMKWLRD